MAITVGCCNVGATPSADFGPVPFGIPLAQELLSPATGESVSAVSSTSSLLEVTPNKINEGISGHNYGLWLFSSPMGAGRPKEHRKKLTAYVRKDTHAGIRKMVDKADSSRKTVGRAVDSIYQCFHKEIHK